jgi:flavin-dependent dehydrogenase
VRWSGVEWRAGVVVKSVDVEKTEIVLEDRDRIHGDLIIAADGVHVSFGVFPEVLMLTWM